MPKKRLIEEIVANPSRYYRAPVDVLRDRRFGDSERARILEAWVLSADDADPDLRRQIEESLGEIAGRGVPPGSAHTAGPAD